MKVSLIYHVCLTVIIMSTVSIYAQTQISGSQSGILGPGKYLVVGDITVEAGKTLEVAPGTEFLHSGHYVWNVNGLLKALGNKIDSIHFIRQNPVESHRWAGLRFLKGAADSSKLDYCVIDNCKNTGSINGGGVYCDKVIVIIRNSRISNCELGENGAGAGIYASEADILVEQCLITNNSAENGGGINMSNCKGAVVRHSAFANNKTTGTWIGCGGGGVRCGGSSTVTVIYNVIYENTAPYYGGGVLANMGSSMHLSNNTIVKNRCTENESKAQGGGVCAIGVNGIVAKIEGINNIIYDNTSYNDPECSKFVDGSFSFTYTCCKNSISGTGNITSDPEFIDPGNYDFRLQENSPCIDAGDPNSPDDPDGTRADMGALYYHQGTASKPIYNTDTYSLQLVYQKSGNGTIIFSFKAPGIGGASLNIFDSQGRKIKELYNGSKNTGISKVIFNTNNILSGVYFACLRGEYLSNTQKIVIHK